MPPLLLSLAFTSLSRSPAPLPLRPIGAVISKGVHSMFIDSELKKHSQFIDAELGKSAWFSGKNFTGADIQMSFPLEALEERSHLDHCPNIKKFLKAIRERPAYQRALEKGGPVII